MNYKTILAFLVGILISSVYSQQDGIPYSVPNNLWEEKLGNHRAIIGVTESVPAVRLNFLWRRHDKTPEEKRFLIVNAESGENVKNIYRQTVTSDQCDIIFGPTQPGVYYFYYLPYYVQPGWGFYNKPYVEQEGAPDKNWVENNQLHDLNIIEKLPTALVKAIQSRTQFDSFYPMEVIPTKGEKNGFLKNIQQDYLLFPEDRKFPIRMTDEIPLKWTKQAYEQKFIGSAEKNEYYVFQIGVLAKSKTLEKVIANISELVGQDGEIIPADNITCFNTEGVDPLGKTFIKELTIQKDRVQALWFGVDLDEKVKAGSYKGQIIISPGNSQQQLVDVELTVSDRILADRGDSELWRHSRLRWLNSTRGISDEPTPPYLPIKITGNRIEILGRELELAETLLPSQVKSWGTEILNRSMDFCVETKKGKEKLTKFKELKNNKTKGSIERTIECQSESFNIQIQSTAEFDGYINYKVQLNATKKTSLKDVRLEIPMKKTVAQQMMGLRSPGQEIPEKFNEKWGGPHDSFWIGNTFGGIHCELRGSDYHGPLLNLFHPEPPASWHNNDKGGLKIEKWENEVLASAYSGSRKLKKGEQLSFEFSLLITPVKKVNPIDQFTNRYYHSGGAPSPTDEDVEKGVRIINVHHANDFNPYINYPFIANKELRGLVDKMHGMGVKVKLYYTIRELTNHVAEIWALRSLGEEVFAGGSGGGFPWLKEHLVENYAPQWYQHFEDKPVDASIKSSPQMGRWYNYYIEGLAWLVENMDIDGLYLDDVSYDRRILKRMRRVMDEVKPGCLMDLHSNTGFSKGPATQYAEFFPFVDKLWFGESFQYDEMSPANWLVEVSGIPFGQMGDMLHGGGNPWRGMVYGMTVRYPWTTEGVYCDPMDIWGVWDDFGIADSKMVGYWDMIPIVSTTNEKVLATAYLKENKMLVSVASWSKKNEQIKLNIKWSQTNLDRNKIKIIAPQIKGFQPAKEFEINDPIPVEPRKGWLLYVVEE